MDATQIARVEAEQEPLDADALATEGAWSPRSLRDVEWSLECIGESEAEIAAIEAQEADAIARIRQRVARIKESAERRASYFRGRVAEWAESHRAEILAGKKKSRELVAGVIGWRKKGGRLRVVDKAALAEWAAAQPVELGLFRVKVEPEVAEIQKHAKASGEIPPGCEWEEEHDEIHIEAASLMLPKETP